MTPSRCSLGPLHGRRLVIAAAAVCLGIVAAWGPPLGHDEAVYALGGDSLLHPSAGTYPHYRSDGMRLLAATGLLVGRTDLALRILPVGLTILLLLVSSGKSLKMAGIRRSGSRCC